MIQLSILSAGEKRIENLKRAEQREREKEKEAQKFREEKPQRIEELTEKIFNHAKKQIEKSDLDFCTVLIIEDDLWKWRAYYKDETLEAIDIVISLIKLAGYEVDDFYEYSKAWQTRSGKIGYFSVRWGERA